MMHDTQIEKILQKLKNIEEAYAQNIFERVLEIPAQVYETEDHLRSVPSDVQWAEAHSGMSWGGPWMTAWFKGKVQIPPEYHGERAFVTIDSSAVEGFCFINGKPKGIITNPNNVLDHLAHTHVMLADASSEETNFEVAFECYAGHPMIGWHPFENYGKVPADLGDFRRVFRNIWLTVMRDDIKDFVFDLRALRQLVTKLPSTSFRRAEVINALIEVYSVIVQYPVDHDETEWRPKLTTARAIMKPILEQTNSQSAPYAGIIGHSHMDTAWLWTVDETIRKCARTYANVLTLMDQYPEYTFMQSSALHLDWMRKYYPDIFAGIKQRVAEGRYEPNGGVWVECDGNMTSGEAMIRQFLWGQRFTREHFGYTSDTFWLPDTFGYSAAIPQIMKGCNIDYFLTTKLDWNDTTSFPYHSFIWRGIDGSEVLAHLNCIDVWPDVNHVSDRVAALRQKHVSDMRLLSYGHGDGGGGPQYEMLEAARRIRDLDGCPRAEHTTVSKFMNRLEDTAKNLPYHNGELYVELHRGTLTQMHEIKRNNRLAELALRDLEIHSVLATLVTGSPKNPLTNDLWETLLRNQFHDILPGTCIPEAHDQAIEELSEVVATARSEQQTVLSSLCRAGSAVTVFNTLSWERNGQIAIDRGCADGVPKSNPYQEIETVFGEQKLVIGDLQTPPMSAETIELTHEPLRKEADSAFRYEGNTLTTTHLRVTFDSDGFITSLVDLSNDRELRGNGYPLNTFLMAEDVPAAWDNWDIDADTQLKLEPVAVLQSREVVADGPLQFRIRSVYRIGRSEIKQDMVFYADTARIDFETVIDWQSPHSLLKVDFDVNVFASTMRNEIQFGHLERPTHFNTPYDAAKFEVSNHKWTDISENRYGVAILNDCKYGISAHGSDLRLTLHKGGCRPDPRGDVGVHQMTYSLLPHNSGFTTESVIRPAYELNCPMQAVPGTPPRSLPPLVAVDAPNVIVEAIKHAEDEQAYVIRLYEPERSATKTTLSFGFLPKRVVNATMLEEPLNELDLWDNRVQVSMRAFEIKTILAYY